MKTLIVVLLLSGVVAMGKPIYRIKTWKEGSTTYYLPQRRVWASANYFKLPYKVWESGPNPYQYKFIAEEVIDGWKAKETKIINKPEYIN